MEVERAKRRAVLRIILGNAQMMAAVITLVLLWRLGVSAPTMIAGVIAAVLVLTSVVLFRVIWRQ